MWVFAGLIEKFPKEAGISKDMQRILPFLPGPKVFITDATTTKRRAAINAYCQDLASLPHIFSSASVADFFRESREDRMTNARLVAQGEMDANASGAADGSALGAARRRRSEADSAGGVAGPSRENLLGSTTVSEDELRSGRTTPGAGSAPNLFSPDAGGGAPKSGIKVKIHTVGCEDTLIILVGLTVGIHALRAKVAAKLPMDGKELYIKVRAEVGDSGTGDGYVAALVL
ncbi:hypothetical protein BDK51DRAFT_28532 [Blyttiomyces helicus]|uniref:PX domain-containing protein n=1 Tax=Blyttiomyces helicus TaxID=388810 RepID=A0A4P9WBW9_9FUNG|nr:hypothetical protein BDK51DRAFT_28532 [Blyttiomyces helicus]|eukprot:RKO90129.1 hypothetical protein BDK51DRAFT_28532 [Blyttiomyces helicus]